MGKMGKLIALLTVILSIAVVSCKKESAPAAIPEEQAPATTSVEATTDIVDAVSDVTADVE